MLPLKTIIVFFISSTMLSQDYILPLWNEKIPNHNGIKIEEIIDTNEIMMIKAVDQPNISVYLPTEKNRNGMAAIVIPGGGYNILAYDWEGTEIAKWLNSKGITAIVLKYRLPHTKNNVKGRLSPFLDLQRAIRLTRFNSEKWGLDQNKVGVMGFSAGGHLASTLGTHFGEENIFNTDAIDSISCRPDFMVLMYPVITFKEPYLHMGSRHFLIGDSPDTALINYYSNELHVSKNTPPTFLALAGDDKSVPVQNSIMFYEKLHGNSVPAEMHIYPKGGHGFSLALGKGYLESWTDRCIDWMRSLEK